MIALTSTEQFDQLIDHKADFILFKNSATCSISSGACKEVYQAIDALSLDNIYILEVLDYPTLKMYVAEKTGITHESPQLLIFKTGVVSAYANHGAITYRWIQEHIGTP